MSTLIPTPTNRPVEFGGSQKKGGPPLNRVLWTAKDGTIHKVEYLKKSRLSLFNRIFNVNVKMGEGDYVVFKRSALKGIGHPGKLSQKAKEVASLIEDARNAAATGVWAKSSDVAAVTPQESFVAKKEKYKRLVMGAKLGKITPKEKDAIAEEVSEWATTQLPEHLLALSEGRKPRFPEKPRRKITDTLRRKGFEAAKLETVEPHITKFRVNKQGQIIVSVELPLGQGGAKTVRRKLELNLSTETTRVVGYSRGLKIFSKSDPDTRVIREDLAMEVDVSKKLQEARVEGGLVLTPVLDETGSVKAYESEISEEGSAAALTQESIPSGERRYTGNTLREHLSVGRNLFTFLKGLHGENKVHGDIKPDNILIFMDEHGFKSSSVIDYGTVREAGGRLAEGTPLYLPPEKAQRANKPADCYAAGITLKQLVYGPNAKVTRAEVLGDLIPGDPIDDVIRGLCDPNPETRMTAEEAERRLSEILT